ncbi:glycoside hydrolase family 99-like domain-containing protein [Kosakonia sacchari]|uniref:glycosyltransferase WbsX family protein n=1 Tax=Kosakonia sacchari TaxID=1158459 RepID=UPI002ACEC64F|nr:glycoside hydrolase family 99-like domain-containing protein [Kosakonia sacchari]MDZ7320185.1 glycoside hydrolase family 99-like domain-containing protein [Kosakonia sacchari]
MQSDKIFCFYFPQFYSIPQNDFHWGKGFTDWDNVRSAEPLYSGHKQPRVPESGIYYDQSQPETLIQQAALAKKYGVDGFSFYHYWFDGELVLEKPMENLLSNPDIDLEFYITWANETWSKRWVGEDDVIIFKQTHENNRDIWKKHYDYLLRFWKDPRYLRIDGKPVFSIYNPHLIKNAKEMFAYWNQLLHEDLGCELYFVGVQVSEFVLADVYEDYNNTLNFEPRFTYNSSANSKASFFSRSIFKYLRYLPESILNKLTKIRYKISSYENVDYNSIWAGIINNSWLRCQRSDNNYGFYGAFVDWDNTARYKSKSKIYTGANPANFEKNFLKLIDITKAQSSKRIFVINAWNEWSEGAYLEPDTVDGNAYLEAVQRIKCRLE